MEKLQAKGFRYVLVGTGTDKNSGVKLGGDNQNVHKSLQFLREFNRGAELNLGKRVAVVGAGNTAMDCARAAACRARPSSIAARSKRCPPGAKSTMRRCSTASTSSGYATRNSLTPTGRSSYAS
ncbi:MAG: FAD-dependent oxidoreductase [Klebsiella michiganensis]|nr:FAD-dependent oxidoreductase [Klebsiella michiganensis]